MSTQNQGSGGAHPAAAAKPLAGVQSNEQHRGEDEAAAAAPGGPTLRLRAVATHPTAWQPSSARLVLNVVMDAAIVEAPPPVGARVSYSHVVVLDDFIGEDERVELLEAVTAPGWDHTAGPPTGKWERSTCDGAGLPPTWGLKADVLESLMTSDLRAVLEVQSRLCLLYPEYDIVHLPSSVIQQRSQVAATQASSRMLPGASEATPSSFSCPSKTIATGREAAFDCCPILANAAVAGDAFQWHVDADPAALPPSHWTATFGDYCNGDPGKPLLVSLVLYLDADWPRSFDAETLFIDTADDVGVIVRPKRLRAVLMDQDVLHRLSAPSKGAGRPRYSLVWKLAFLQRNRENKAACSIARPEWGRPTPIGSAARFEQLKRQLVPVRGQRPAAKEPRLDSTSGSRKKDDDEQRGRGLPDNKETADRTMGRP
mmetsp:Transcript_2194/g.6499  ORF Transcript_2194/g.6499 Transcript_2194/m.6499 type:complete len:428 (-) Transcript_2194:172-1455(-)